MSMRLWATVVSKSESWFDRTRQLHALIVRRSHRFGGTGEDASRRRRQRQRDRRAGDDAADARGGQRSSERRRDRSLIAKGADVNAKSLAGETALDWARKNGSPVALELLTGAGAVETKHAPAVVPAPAHSELRVSVEKSVALLRKASVVAAANGGCASCHSHNVVDTLERAAARKGLSADDKLTGQRQTLTRAPYFSAANLLERLDPAGSPITTVFALTALANSDYQPDRTTDMVAAHLATQQARNGRWFMSGIARPPVGEGPVAVTAYAIRALKAYAPPGRASDMNERIARASAWLAAQKPITTEIATCSCSGCCGQGARRTSALRLRSRSSRNSASTEAGHKPTTCRATRTDRSVALRAG